MPKFIFNDWQGTPQTITVGGEIVANNGAVYLLKTGKKFSVVYGLEIREGLSYADAASRYGFAVFHQLACEGKIEC